MMLYEVSSLDKAGNKLIVHVPAYKLTVYRLKGCSERCNHPQVSSSPETMSVSIACSPFFLT